MPRKKPQKSPNTYHAHRERQRRRILDAAWKLFDERGIDRVTMAEITAASGVQPSTIYQYFSNKDEIVWAFLGTSIQESSAHARQLCDDAPSALARLTALLDFMANELINNPVKVRFMSQFDAMYARDWPAERLISLESEINPDGFDVFTNLIREGIADGSLRSDLDPGITMHAVMNAVIGAQRRLASLGDKVEQEYGRSIDQLFRETIRILLLGLRTPETPTRPQPRKANIRKGRTRRRSS
ncbi:MAG TPA: TetR/AcrR family transcriptional regulator [Terracidiphilus sp.]|jgi:AcrR family transcriptional regulator|nr:TetR/AcrR family transcriptional regulator [Terracidiphilus sp.]